MTRIRRRLASLIAFALPALAAGCGEVVLPNESTPASIAIVSGDAQSAPAGAALSSPLVVRVLDEQAVPLRGRPSPSR